MTAALATPLARRAAWIPALVLLAWALLAAAGVQPTPPSMAASTGSTTISASVNPDISIGGTCPGGSLTGVTLNVTDGAIALGGCTVTQTTTNNPAGTTLKVESARASGDSFCKSAQGAACVLADFNQVAGTGGAGALADGNFAVLVNGAQTCSSATWTNANFYSLRDSTTAPGTGDTICSTVQATPGSYTLSFQANPSATQESGTYLAQANFTVEAN